MDIFSRKKRSEIMSKIRGKDTSAELVFLQELKKRRIRDFKRHYDITGKPDFAFPRIKLAVFIDGDFWHGKNFSKWKRKLSPFWLEKISTNIKRDKRTARKLRKGGWHSLHFWDVDVTTNVKKCVDRLERVLHEK